MYLDNENIKSCIEEDDKLKLQVIPLGGLGEIGKNMWVFRYAGKMFIVDAGLMFPTEEMHGVDYVLQDITYLIENKNDILGVILTHGHEDHIGGLTRLIKEIPGLSIYGTKLTLGLVEDKLIETRLLNSTSLRVIKPRQSIFLDNFEIEFFRVSHSIADDVGLIIYTPVGTVVFTSDFKLDPTPVDGETTDFFKLAQAGERGVLLLLSDSTNVDRPAYTPSEKRVGEALNEVFHNAKGRIIVATFATSIHRIQQVINVSMKFNRKIVIVGRSLEKVTKKAKILGYLNLPDELIINIKELDSYNYDKITILTTGSQGEPLSALSRIANKEHKYISIIPGDTVIISSVPIPGNERLVFSTVNKLFSQKAMVIYESNAGMHVSGHASQEELKIMINLTKPKFFIPIHGEQRHLIKHAELAKETGISPENIIIASNGDIIEFTSKSANIIGKVPVGMIMIDGEGSGYVKDKILEERQNLSKEGVIIVSFTIDNNYKLITNPKLVSKGYIIDDYEKDLCIKINEEINQILKNYQEKEIINSYSINEDIIKVIMRLCYKETKRKPIVVPIINQVIVPEEDSLKNEKQ